MSKSKSKRSNKQVVKPRGKVQRKMRGMLLDGPALSYAALLADPCNGPLVHPIYPGTDAGFLFRAESFTSFGTGAGETSGVVHWTPGYPNFNDSEFLYTATAGGGTTGTMASATASPGKTFLATNARGVRCVAACMKVSYNGSEANRSGRFHYGQTVAGTLDNSQVVAPDAVAQALQNYGRTPTDSIELIWKPSQGDFSFCDPSASTSALIRDQKAALTLCFVGLPATAGVTVHMTAVYEWLPAVGLSVGGNTNGKARSVNTTDHVVDFLLDRGFAFVRHFGHTVGAGIVGQTMNMIQSGFGKMPAYGTARNRLDFR
jgi:hypothetical protein